MKQQNTDIVTHQHGYVALARGEHRQPVKNCETCRHYSVSYWDEPCISCCRARQVQGLEDKWESVGPSTARECAEAQILAHLKAVRDIAQEYAGKQFMTASFLPDGAVHIYNAAGYNDSGLPVIDACLKGKE